VGLIPVSSGGHKPRSLVALVVCGRTALKQVRTQIQLKTECNTVVLLIFLVTCWTAAFPARLWSQPSPTSSSKKASTTSVSLDHPDPNKPASELNHHLAGCALIAIGLLVIAGQSSERWRSLRLVWPFLFVVVGCFLAAWSDGEIWPRGNLSWLFLIHHDAEARQHKIYAILLIVMGMIEYLRGRSRLSRFWQIWAFPVLALAGVGLLLVHDHTAGSGATSPEARKYMVPWSVGAAPKVMVPTAADPKDPHASMHHHETEGVTGPAENQPLQMAAQYEMMGTHDGRSSHQHQMTEAMLRVEREHMGFALVGIGVLLFKVICDAALWRRAFVPYLWPSCVTLLGILLVFYTE
jgi:hypothetical protein